MPKTISTEEIKNIQRRIKEPPFAPLRKMIERLRLFPQTHDFFSYFEKSSENVTRGARLLCTMIAKPEDRHSLVIQLKDLEHVGDRITYEVIDLVRETFLTPIDRTDIHMLAVRLDDVLDLVYYTGNRMTRYNVDRMPQQMSQLAELVCQSSIAVSKAINGLREMKKVQNILDHCGEVNRLEKVADEATNAAIEELFNGNWDPFQVIKLKELIEHLEAAVDKCEDVANIVEGIILKSA